MHEFGCSELEKGCIKDKYFPNIALYQENAFEGRKPFVPLLNEKGNYKSVLCKI
jgi:hypothetical protein